MHPTRVHLGTLEVSTDKRFEEQNNIIERKSKRSKREINDLLTILSLFSLHPDISVKIYGANIEMYNIDCFAVVKIHESHYILLLRDGYTIVED